MKVKKTNKFIMSIITMIMLISCFNFFSNTSGKVSQVKADGISWAKGEFNGTYTPTESADDMKKDKGSIFTKSSVCNSTIYIVYTKMGDAATADTLNSGVVTFKKFNWSDYHKRGASIDFKSRYTLIENVDDLHSSDWYVYKRKMNTYSMLVFLKPDCYHLDAIKQDISQDFLYNYDEIHEDDKAYFVPSKFFSNFHVCTTKTSENTVNSPGKKFYTNEGKKADKCPWKYNTLEGHITATEYIKKGACGGTVQFQLYAKTSTNNNAYTNIYFNFSDSMTITSVIQNSTCVINGQANVSRVFHDNASAVVDKVILARNNTHAHTTSDSTFERCDKPYVVTTYCSDCGKKLNEVQYSATQHKIKATRVSEPTCTEPGCIVYECTVPGCQMEAYDEEIPALGHDYDNGKITTNATCTDEGEMTFTCKRCSHEEYKSISRLAHVSDGKYVTEYEPTCTEDGMAYTHCKTCGKNMMCKVLKRTGHDWDKGEITQEPTKTRHGEKMFTCKTCGTTKIERIPAKSQTTTTQPNTTDDDDVKDNDKDYKDSTKIKNKQIKINQKVNDKSSGAKYRITSFKKVSGKVVSGTVTYVRPNNKNCTKMTAPKNVKIGGVKFKVTSISAKAFKGCKNLTSVTIETNVKTIGKSAFYGCSKLRTINIRSQKITGFGANCFKGISSKAVVRVPGNRLDKYKKKLNINSGLPITATIKK